MQGVYPRLKSKSALKVAVKMQDEVSLEATSMFGNEYDGDLYSAPDGTDYVGGPDPYKNRKWYATIKKSGDTIKVS